MLLQLTDRCQAVNGISCKAAHAFCYDEIDFSCQRICDHCGEAFAFRLASAGHTFVGIYPDKLPVITRLNVLGIIIDLCIVGTLLLLVIRGYSCVCCHLPFRRTAYRLGGEGVNGWRQNCYCSH